MGRAALGQNFIPLKKEICSSMEQTVLYYRVEHMREGKKNLVGMDW